MRLAANGEALLKPWRELDARMSSPSLSSPSRDSHMKS